MAEVNLEAEQAVKEEKETPAKSGGGGGLFARKGLMVLGVVMVVEAVLMFFFFNTLHHADPAHAAGPGHEDVPQDASLQATLEPRALKLGEISIWDESESQAPKRYTAEFTVWVDKDTFHEIELAAEENPDAMGNVIYRLSEAVHEWMLRTGGEAMRTKELQANRAEKIKDFLNDQIPALRNRIVGVEIRNFKPAKS